MLSPFSFGIEFSHDHCKAPQQVVSWKDRHHRRVALERCVVVPGKEADGGEHTDMLGMHGQDRSPMKQGSDPMPRDLGF